jgi:quinol monooxygenase YgiN
MKAVVVRYRVKADFVDENKRNIEQVLIEHRERAHPGVRYTVHQDKDDAQNFVHVGMYADEAALDSTTALESFKAFQAALRGSGPESKPSATWLSTVGAGFDLFG